MNSREIALRASYDRIEFLDWLWSLSMMAVGLVGQRLSSCDLRFSQRF